MAEDYRLALLTLLGLGVAGCMHGSIFWEWVSSGRPMAVLILPRLILAVLAHGFALRWWSQTSWSRRMGHI